MRRTRVITSCVADAYVNKEQERIIEFSDSRVWPAGGLIAFRRTPDGRLTVSVYALDGPVEVIVGADTPVYAGGVLVSGAPAVAS